MSPATTAKFLPAIASVVPPLKSRELVKGGRERKGVGVIYNRC